MKNYKIKVKDLFPGTAFYHKENSGAYMGKGTYIINIAKDEHYNPKNSTKAGPIRISLLDDKGNLGMCYADENDYVYPLGEWENVTILNRLWWRLRQLMICLKFL